MIAVPDEVLGRLGVPAEHLARIEADRPDPEAVRHHAQLLIDDMGGFDERPPLPAMPGYFYLYVFLAVLPHVREYHRARGIPDELSWAALSALGGHVTDTGLVAPDWLTLHFRGGIYPLGRLAFNRGRLDFFGPSVPGAGPDTYALGVHVPGGGPLDPAACDASFDRARDFFARHFPEEPYRYARCGSWLLDDQLADYLPEGSNIVRFQRRFHLIDETRPADDEVLATVAEGTALRRAVVEHLAAGGHWRIRFGWLPL